MARATDNEDEQGSTLKRRHFVRGLAGLGAVGAVGIVSADPAAAADGDALLLGEENTSTADTTLITDTDGIGLDVRGSGFAALGAQTSNTNSKAINARHESTDPSAITVFADAEAGIALVAQNDSAVMPALAGHNKGDRWGVAAATGGDGGQLLLSVQPGSALGPPTSGQRGLGELRMDLNGDLWVCVEDGTPGTWTRLLREDQAPGRTIPITPIRALDTRATGGRASGAPAVPGQRKGPLKGGESVTLDLAGVAPIPPTASGIIGNATVLTPSGNGFLRILPAGASVPASSFNFTRGTTIANGFTSALSATGLRAVAPISAGITYHLVIDIAAYIT